MSNPNNKYKIEPLNHVIAVQRSQIWVYFSHPMCSTPTVQPGEINNNLLYMHWRYRVLLCFFWVLEKLMPPYFKPGVVVGFVDRLPMSKGTGKWERRGWEGNMWITICTTHLSLFWLSAVFGCKDRWKYVHVQRGIDF